MRVEMPTRFKRPLSARADDSSVTTERQNAIALVTPPDVIAAKVVAMGVCTCYQSAGRGPAVVVVSAIPARVHALLARIPRHFRVIAPQPCGPMLAADCDFMGWIDSFLEALGLSHLWMVADAEFAVSLTDYARAVPDRVRGLVVLDSPACGRVDDDGGSLDAMLGGIVSFIDRECGLHFRETPSAIRHSLTDASNGTA
jgi:hypothetical protein